MFWIDTNLSEEPILSGFWVKTLLVFTYKSTWCHILQVHRVNTHHRANQKPYMGLAVRWDVEQRSMVESYGRFGGTLAFLSRREEVIENTGHFPTS